ADEDVADQGQRERTGALANAGLGVVPNRFVAAEIKQFASGMGQANTGDSVDGPVDFARKAGIEQQPDVEAYPFVGVVSEASAEHVERAVGPLGLEVEQELTAEIKIAFHTLCTSICTGLVPSGEAIPPGSSGRVSDPD